MATWVINVAMVTLITTVNNVPMVSVHTSVILDNLVAKVACHRCLLWLANAPEMLRSVEISSCRITQNVIAE